MSVPSVVHIETHTMGMDDRDGKHFVRVRVGMTVKNLHIPRDSPLLAALMELTEVPETEN